MGAPGDHNLVELGVNAGVTLKAPFKGRDNDEVGIAVGYAHIASHAQDLAGDTAEAQNDKEFDAPSTEFIPYAISLLRRFGLYMRC